MWMLWVKDGSWLSNAILKALPAGAARPVVLTWMLWTVSVRAVPFGKQVVSRAELLDTGSGASVADTTGVPPFPANAATTPPASPATMRIETSAQAAFARRGRTQIAASRTTVTGIPPTIASTTEDELISPSIGARGYAACALAGDAAVALDGRTGRQGDRGRVAPRAVDPRDGDPLAGLVDVDRRSELVRR